MDRLVYPDQAAAMLDCAPLLHVLSCRLEEDVVARLGSWLRATLVGLLHWTEKPMLAHRELGLVLDKVLYFTRFFQVTLYVCVCVCMSIVRAVSHFAVFVCEGIVARGRVVPCLVPQGLERARSSSGHLWSSCLPPPPSL